MKSALVMSANPRGAVIEGGRLVVTRLDRLSRSTLDFGNLLVRAEREGWAVVVLDMDLDTHSANGRMVAKMMIVFAEGEREIISERTKEGMQAAMARGVRIGRPSTVPDGTHLYIADLRARDLTWQQVTDMLNSEGVPTPSGKGSWHPASARRHSGVPDG